MKEIEITTMQEWLKNETIIISSLGNENVYFIDKFGNEFFCKCYPKKILNILNILQD